MTRHDVEQETVQAGWRTSVRRHWPWVAFAIVVSVAGAWWLRRSRGDEIGAQGHVREARAAQAADSVIRLDTAAQRMAGIETLVVSPSSGGVLTANGTITYDANRVSVIASRVEGRISSVRTDLGQVVPAGATLAVVESPEVAQIRGDLEGARVHLDAARRNYEREKRLFEQSITPQKELLQAEADFRSIEADYNSARSRLRAVGAGEGTGATFGLVTSLAGTIVERNASPGQLVGPAADLFTVADLSHVWITVDVYEGDLARVRIGAPAAVVPAALPNGAFRGHVTYAGGVVDPASHTFKVRVELPNPGLELRPGMFAQVQIQTPSGGSGASASSFVVPEVAVQEVAGRPVVFVAASRAGEYTMRTVTTAAGAGSGKIVITTGLRGGERIVTKGAFQLKAELTKSSFSEEG